jgi:Ni/Co efflux regulator RcnB
MATMKLRQLAAMLIGLLAALHVLGAAAQGNSDGKGNSGKETRGEEVVGLALVAAGISALQAREVVQRHGITGGKPLPPGIRKNLARGKPLPPGIARSRNLPEPLLQELPYHDGYEWRRAGEDLVLVAVATELVADVLLGVFE